MCRVWRPLGAAWRVQAVGELCYGSANGPNDTRGYAAIHEAIARSPAARRGAGATGGGRGRGGGARGGEQTSRALSAPFSVIDRLYDITP